MRLLPIIALVACVAPEPAQYMYGVDLEALELNVRAPNMGIHPNTTVLDDPDNPFVRYPTDEELRWEITDHPNPVAGFYIWATYLAIIPIGENQFYVAEKLDAIVQQGRAKPEELPFLDDLATRAFESVLKNFPDSVTFDATGTVATPLSTWACIALLDRGEVLPPGWILAQDAEGSQLCTQQPLEVE
ncbi:MAG: hypothetical protein ACI8PZ_000950 [Myxococcota bacterium]